VDNGLGAIHQPLHLFSHPGVKPAGGVSLGPFHVARNLVDRWEKNETDLAPAGYKAAGRVLSVYAHDLVKAKRMDPADEAHNVKALARDLQEYPLYAIERALQSHKKGNDWWPSLAGLMRYIDPILEPKHREKERLRADIKRFNRQEPEYVEPPREVRQRGVALAREVMAEIEMEGAIADQKLLRAGRRGWPARPKRDHNDPEELRRSRIRLGIPMPGDLPEGEQPDV